MFCFVKSIKRLIFSAHDRFNFDVKFSLKKVHLNVWLDVTTPLGGSWRRHQMETFSALLAQRPVTRSFDVFFDLHLNKQLSKQSRGWWFETPSGSLWHQCNVITMTPYLLRQRIKKIKRRPFMKEFIGIRWISLKGPVMWRPFSFNDVVLWLAYETLELGG